MALVPPVEREKEQDKKRKKKKFTLISKRHDSAKPQQKGFLSQCLLLLGAFKANIFVKSHSTATKKSFNGETVISVFYLESSTQNDWFGLNMKVKPKNIDQAQKSQHVVVMNKTTMNIPVCVCLQARTSPSLWTAHLGGL